KCVWRHILFTRRRRERSTMDEAGRRWKLAASSYRPTMTHYRTLNCSPLRNLSRRRDCMILLRRVPKFFGVWALLLPLLPLTVFAQHYQETYLVSSIPGVGTNPTNGLD